MCQFRYIWIQNTKSLTIVRRLLYLFLLVTFFITPSVSQTCLPTVGCVPKPRNLLNKLYPQRTVDASSTCGLNGQSTQYCTLSSLSCTGSPWTAYICNGSTPHPAAYMFDVRRDPVSGTDLPEYTTYWQSDNTIAMTGLPAVQQFVTINLTDLFMIRKISVAFTSPFAAADDLADMRPSAMAIQAKKPTDADWVTWRYFASDCPRFYPNAILQMSGINDPSYSATTPVCVEKYFSGDFSTLTADKIGMQGVTFYPANDFGLEYLTSFDVQTYYMASMIRLQFDYPARSESLLSYYAIANLEIDGSCACYGHSSECTGTNDNECICLHNTDGVHCDSCKALYNSVPWTIGTPQNASVCQKCNCSEFGLSCHYDPYRGLGICDNCTQYTTGDNCEFCVDYFYVNPNRPSAPVTTPSNQCYGYAGGVNATYNCNGPCISCGCNPIGTSDMSLFNCANATGQCLCKVNVGGRACDSCLVGFWNLGSDNVFGCQPCSCNWYGTVNNSNTCDKSNGTCTCKKYVLPGQCDTCQVGYFNLNADNEDGCSFCDCDLGASLNPICPADSGICSCKSLTGGRTCRDPYPGFFGPSLDYLTYEAELPDNATSNYYDNVVLQVGQGEPDTSITGLGLLTINPPFFLSFIVVVPLTLFYNVFIRFENMGASYPNVKVILQLLNPELELTNQFQCSGTNFTTQDPQQLTGTIPPLGTQAKISFGRVCLYSSATARYQMTIQIPEKTFSAVGTSNLLLDSVVIMPALDQVNAYNIANSSMKDRMNLCYSLTQNISITERMVYGCPSVEYSLMTDIYEGAIGCNCNPIGSRDYSCQPLGGQCNCKPNVIMRDCSQCRVDAYGFSSGLGCTLCSCNTQGSVQPMCVENGICICRPNVLGDKCDRCLDNYFGLYTGTGCTPCVCNATYTTLNGSCFDDGQCLCKPGVGGIQCDRCANNYYNLTLDGCTSCGCDADGSRASLACNNGTGGCYCKMNTLGTNCDTCLDGFYGLGPWGNEGCIPCYCSGRSTNCSSAPDWHAVTVSSTWNLLSDSTATQEKWAGVDENWRTFDLPNPTLITADDASHVMRLENDAINSQSQRLYFLSTASYLGNKRGAYGQNLSFALNTRVPPLTVKENFYVSATDGDVILQGTSASYVLVYQLPKLPAETRTNYVVRLHEDNWFVNSTSGMKATYAQMQQILGSIKSLRIRAKFYQVLGSTTDLYFVSLNYAVYDPMSSTPVVNNVEQCSCPLEYTGQFCELCSPGYTRKIPGSGLFTECGRCFCNNHDLENTTCDPETGACVCTHNATGRQCELCLSGFYGHALSGRTAECRPCMCPGSISARDVNVFASTCDFSSIDPQEHTCNNCSTGHSGSHCETCMDQFYGTPTDPSNNRGQCLACTCNGRAATCNSTSGECINCTSSSTGRNCDECTTGFYGNPMVQQCRPCPCTGIGMTGECDPLTGMCRCKPYVTGFNCDRCQLYSYTRNFTTDGCQPCNCSVQGSLGDPPSCDMVTGQCDCKMLVKGLHCDQCEDTFWNVGGYGGCEVCDCSVIGTANFIGQPYGTCDVTSGQCQCKTPGIGGRRCDMCGRATSLNFTHIYGLSIGTYPDCQLCGDCYDNIGSQVDTIASAMEASYLQIGTLWSDSYSNITLDVLMSSITSLGQNLTSCLAVLLRTNLSAAEVNQLSEGWMNASLSLWMYNDRADSGFQTRTYIQTNLVVLRTFLSSDITFGGMVIPKPDPFRALFNNSKANQDGLFSDASTTYSTIRNNFNILVNGSGIVDAMKAQVKTAMLTLDKAKQWRTMAESLQSQTPSFDQSVRLNAVESAVMSVQSLYDANWGMFYQMNGSVVQAGMFITDGETTCNTNYNLTFSASQSSQSASYSASKAQESAQLAKISVDRFYNMASSTKQTITRAVELIAGALLNLQTMTTTGTNISNMIFIINGLQMVPVSTMQDLSRAISQLQVPPDKVASVAAAANQNLSVTNDVLRSTVSAQNKSKTALSELNRAISQTSNATLLSSNADSIMTNGWNLISNINNVALAVSTKATDAIAVSTLTDVLLTNISVSLSSLQAQFSLLPNRVHVARQSAEQSQSKAENSLTTYTANKANSDSLQSQFVLKSDTISQQKATMLATRTEFFSYQSELSNLAQSLRGMNSEVSAQLEDLRGLYYDLTYLENQMAMLTMGLDQLGTSPVSCAL